jgi:hypothetical protein
MPRGKLSINHEVEPTSPRLSGARQITIGHSQVEVVEKGNSIHIRTCTPITMCEWNPRNQTKFLQGADEIQDCKLQGTSDG